MNTEKRILLSRESFEPEYDVSTKAAKTELKPPKKYRVVLLNDDFTTMDFVVEVLTLFFNMSEEQAVQVMIMVHKKGKGACGVYSRDVAETKATSVNEYAQKQGHPLLCKIEKMD